MCLLCGSLFCPKTRFIYSSVLKVLHVHVHVCMCMISGGQDAANGNDETSAMVPNGEPPPDNCANGNVPNGTGAGREERPMVPPTGDNSVAQVSDTGPARYIPAIGVTKPNACRLL